MQLEDYCQTKVPNAGTFRAFPLAWTVQESTKEDSRSVAIVYRFGISQEWHGAERGWSEQWPTGYYAEFFAYVVNREGEIIQGAIDKLAAAGLWDGDWDKLAGPCPQGFFVHVEVGENTYGGKTSYRVDWVNPDAPVPQARGFAPASEKLLANLKTRFQQKTRAAAAGRVTGPVPAPPQPTPAAAGAHAQQPVQPAVQPATQQRPATPHGAAAVQPQPPGMAPPPRTTAAPAVGGAPRPATTGAPTPTAPVVPMTPPAPTPGQAWPQDSAEGHDGGEPPF